MSDQQPQFVRCVNNPEHVYPAYLPECDICAMMRMRPQAPAPVYNYAPADLSQSRFAPVPPAYGNNPIMADEEPPSDQEIFKKYGVAFLAALGAFALITIVVVNLPHGEAKHDAAADVASTAGESSAPPTRSAVPSGLPIANSAAAMRGVVASNFNPTNPGVASPNYTRVDMAGNSRYYSDRDLKGGWTVSAVDDGSILGSYDVADDKGKLIAKVGQWRLGPSPGDLTSGNYDGITWDLVGDKTDRDSISYKLTYVSNGYFDGYAIGAGKRIHVSWVRMKQSTVAVSN